MKKLLSFILTAGLLLTSAVSVSAAYEVTPYDLPANGVHFSFDGTCTDDSGELAGNPVGTIEYIEGHDGKANGAVYLDSSDDHIELLKEDYYGDWSISAWVRTDEAVAWALLTISHDYSVRPIQFGNVLGEAGVSQHNLDDPDENLMFSSGLPLGEWAMFTVVHDSENETISWYLNGKFIETADMSIPLALTLIGNDSEENRGWMVDPFMAIDDLWMFGRIITAEEVTELYNTNTITAAASEAEPEEAEITVEEAEIVEAPEAVEETAEAPEAEETEAPTESNETADSAPVQTVSPQTADAMLLAACFAMVYCALAFVFRKLKA